MSSEDELETFKQLVPFYVNGTLEGEQRAAFEEALARQPELQREVEAERALQQRFNAALKEEIDSAGESGAALARTAKTAGESRDEGGLARALSFLNPANWKPAVTLGVVAIAAAQTAVIGGQATMIASLEEENYALASGQKDCDAEPDVIISVADDAVWSQVLALLNTEELQIVGSTAQGLLQLKASDEDADIAPVIERLQASDTVSSAYAGA